MTTERGHILREFDRALETLRADVLLMARLTEQNLQNVRRCLLDRKAELCVLTIAAEEEINALEKKIDADGIELLLRFQPVASDLRQVLSAMKLGSNLERVADQAVKIARRSRKLSQRPALAELSLIEPMFEEALALFADSVRAYAEHDVACARLLKARDRKVDEMNRSIGRELTAIMSNDPDRITDYLNLLFIARHLERVGDHGTNIAEDTVYAAEAEDIRHLANTLSESSVGGPAN